MKKAKQTKSDENRGALPGKGAEMAIEFHDLKVERLVESSLETQQRRMRRLQKDKEKFHARLESLGNSIIETGGVMQPIIVRPRRDMARADKMDVFEIVVGWRRWRASKLKNLPTIRCFIRDLTDAQILGWQYDENHEREESNPLDDAFYFKVLIEQENYSLDALADRFNKKLREVEEILSLNDLIAQAVEEFEDGRLPLKHAVFISTFPSNSQREIVAGKLAYRWGDEASGALPFREFELEIGENIIRDLQTAPFDTESPDLHLKGLKCLDCTRRSSYKPMLFPELRGKDSCLDKKCFDFKTNTHLRIQRDRIAAASLTHINQPIEEAIKSVPLVTDRKFIQKEKIPFTEKILTGQTLLDEPECKYSVMSLAVEGGKKGKDVYVCREKACAVHNPPPVEKLETRTQLLETAQRFERTVAVETRYLVLRQAAQTLDDYTPFWQFDDLIRDLIFQLLWLFHGDDHHPVSRILSEWKMPNDARSNEAVMQRWIAALDKTRQSRLLFLLTYQNASGEKLAQIADDYARRDLKRFDAEARAHLAPDEFKQAAEEYLDQVKNGIAGEPPRFWTSTGEFGELIIED